MRMHGTRSSTHGGHLADRQRKRRDVVIIIFIELRSVLSIGSAGKLHGFCFRATQVF